MYGISVEEDERELAKPDLPWRKRCAITHRLGCKQILVSNIKLCNVLMRILANLQVELAKGKTEFTKSECKRIYLQRIEGFEANDSEVLANRLRFRNYIRELILNQQRVMEKTAKSEGGQAVLQNLLSKL